MMTLSTHCDFDTVDARSGQTRRNGRRQGRKPCLRVPTEPGTDLPGRPDAAVQREAWINPAGGDWDTRLELEHRQRAGRVGIRSPSTSRPGPP